MNSSDNVQTMSRQCYWLSHSVWARIWLAQLELSDEIESLMRKQTGINDKHRRNARHNDPNMQSRPVTLETAGNIPLSWQLEPMWLHAVP